ncbi:hypothetical protein GIB67_015000 [Kingdonia uniflora]|uniref:Uncharacterized protein n=1 Tax=Kingdonia uniflora TaxID=39325 RepID=A0A7J7MTJ3_9MAGN|nr:hypothetical protein GIB67_015000 [Kingdonia uniflora]
MIVKMKMKRIKCKCKDLEEGLEIVEEIPNKSSTEKKKNGGDADGGTLSVATHCNLYPLWIVWTVNFPLQNLELKDYIPLLAPKENEKLRSKYDLITNVVHDGKPGEGSYRVFIQRKSEELWYVSYLLFRVNLSKPPIRVHYMNIDPHIR